MQKKKPELKRVFLNPAFFLLLAVVGLWALMVWAPRAGPSKPLSLSEFQQAVEKGQVKTATILNRDQRVEGELADGTRYTTAYPDEYGGKIYELLQAKGVNVTVNPQNGSTIWNLLGNILPFLLMIGLFAFLFHQVQGGGNRVLSFGRARAKLVTKDMPKVTFADVAGLDEAVEELKEVRDFLANPAKFQAMGAKIPKGILLYGPPGSGKTLLARAVAGEAGVPFFSISGSDFVEMFVGVGAARVRDLFEQAKAHAPAIIFVDEIDAVGRHRGAGLGGGHDEREQTLNQLLVEMDGFDPRIGVILIAATNRPDILDPALLRPGRFDRHIVVDRPDLNGRIGILKVHTRGKPLGPDVDIELIARRTPGFTGADLANVVNEAALLAARAGKKQITMADMEEAIDRVVAGPERRSRVISEAEKRVIAYHEAGHALVGHALPNADPVHKISIIPRGRALGYTLSLPTEDRFLVTKGELLDQLAMLLAGRVAEELVFAEPTTGAQDDLEKATKIARKMVCEYGMSEKLGPLTLGQKQDLVFLGRDLGREPDYSDRVAYDIDQEVRRLVEEAKEKAASIIRSNRHVLDRIVAELMEKETLEGPELEAILSPVVKERRRGVRAGTELPGEVPAGEPVSVRKGGRPRPKPAPGTLPA